MTDEMEHANLSLESSEIQGKIAKILEGRPGLQAELSSLNAIVRSSKTHKTRLKPDEYRAICNKQTNIKRKIAQMDEEIAPLRQRLREIGALSTVYYAIKNEERKNCFSSNVEIKRELQDIRDRWLQFAEDHTRVNSMRIMAAQFSRELSEVLGKVQ